MSKIKPTMVKYVGMDELGAYYVFKRLDDENLTYLEPHNVWVEKYNEKSGEMIIFTPAGTSTVRVINMLKGLFHPKSNFLSEMKKAFGDNAVLKAVIFEAGGTRHIVTGDDEDG